MEQIEGMRAFFAARVDGYDEHMLRNIEGMGEAYARVAQRLPEHTNTLLDLGCGTGLELGAVFARFPGARVTGIDLTAEMLAELERKYAGKDIELVCASYFDVDFGTLRYDAAISVESLHHFTQDEKRGLYRRVCGALRPGGVYVEADFVAESQAEEDALFAKRERLLAAQGETEGFWHFDTPLTIENELRLLREAGFANAYLDWTCAATAVLVAEKGGNNA